MRNVSHVRIEDTTGPLTPISLGEFREFTLAGAEPGSTADFYLSHNGIRYVRPVNRAGAPSVRIAIEAPGQYTLTAAWRTPDGSSGRTELQFEIRGPSSSGPPQRARLDRRTEVWTSSPWEAAIAEGHETRIVSEVCALIEPGHTVYDIGANIGQFAVSLARRVGRSGKVYCLEANPVCVYFLRANLMLTDLDNFEILPVCLADETRPCRFNITYGNSLLGSVPEGIDCVKPGQSVTMDGRTLDDLIEALNLRPPDCIKLDIEGGESLAIRGMTRTIASVRPIFMVELHGRHAARVVLTTLDEFGYRFRTMGEQGPFRPAPELIDQFPDACLQILASSSR
jgi:FkbM family methyltransferase